MKIAIALGALLLAHPLVAHASKSCGGGGGGGSSGGSSGGGGSSSGGDSSGGSSSSSSSGESSSPPPCIDDTDVVGYRHCTKFGAGWGISPQMPRFFIEMGTNVRQLSGSPVSGRTATVWHGAEQFAYRMVTSADAGDAGATGVASSLRIGFGLGRGMYAGVEGELGGLTSSPARVEMTASGVFGTPETSSGTPLLLGASGFVGVRVASGRASLSVEGAGGVRNVRYDTTSTYHDCVDTTVVSVVQGVVEARARGELWINPWVTLGAQAGANVVARGDWMTGLYVGFHSRAFAGR